LASKDKDYNRCPAGQSHGLVDNCHIVVHKMSDDSAITSLLLYWYVLYVFRLFTEILSKAHDSNDIQFTANGQWSPLMPKEENSKAVDTSVYETIPGSSFDIKYMSRFILLFKVKY